LGRPSWAELIAMAGMAIMILIVVLKNCGGGDS
jgi:hypothetical protein